MNTFVPQKVSIIRVVHNESRPETIVVYEVQKTNTVCLGKKIEMQVYISTFELFCVQKAEHIRLAFALLIHLSDSSKISCTVDLATSMPRFFWLCTPVYCKSSEDVSLLNLHPSFF